MNTAWIGGTLFTLITLVTSIADTVIWNTEIEIKNTYLLYSVIYQKCINFQC